MTTYAIVPSAAVRIHTLFCRKCSKPSEHRVVTSVPSALEVEHRRKCKKCGAVTFSAARTVNSMKLR